MKSRPAYARYEESSEALSHISLAPSSRAPHSRTEYQIMVHLLHSAAALTARRPVMPLAHCRNSGEWLHSWIACSRQQKPTWRGLPCGSLGCVRSSLCVGRLPDSPVSRLLTRCASPAAAAQGTGLTLHLDGAINRPEGSALVHNAAALALPRKGGAALLYPSKKEIKRHDLCPLCSCRSSEKSCCIHIRFLYPHAQCSMPGLLILSTQAADCAPVDSAAAAPHIIRWRCPPPSSTYRPPILPLSDCRAYSCAMVDLTRLHWWWLRMSGGADPHL